MCESGFVSECEYKKLRLLRAHSGSVQGSFLGYAKPPDPTLASLNYEINVLKTESSMLKNRLDYIDQRITEVEHKLEKYQTQYLLLSS
jgi:hypothetical protein